MGKIKNTHWIGIALIAALLGAPNAAIIKLNMAETDPMFFNVVRYLIVVLACALLMIGKYKKLQRGKGMQYAFVSGMGMAIAVTFYVLAIQASQASYVAILTLISPIIFVLVSSFTFREKIKHAAIAGMTLAMLGSLFVVAGPIALAQGSTLTVYPLATFYILINAISFAVSVVWMRRANEAKVPMIGIVGIQGVMVFIVALGLMFAFGDWSRTELTPTLLGSAFYSAIVLAIIVRSINTFAYEKLGAAAISGMSYIETFLAILIPVVLLHETLSIITVIGGVLILCGVYIIERRKVSHKHRHWLHLHRHH